MSPAETLVDAVLAGDRRALARLITRIENRAPDSAGALAALFPHTGRAYLVGITGAPGTGKSTVVNALARTLRAQDRTVGIVAVDPTSPFSGGAVLGDRIRMTDLAGDRGVFIRSMANRGSLGGLAAATGDVVRVLDAAGFDIVLIETVGAGQSEVDIARTAYTTVVVDAPGLGTMCRPSRLAFWKSRISWWSIRPTAPARRTRSARCAPCSSGAPLALGGTPRAAAKPRRRAARTGWTCGTCPSSRRSPRRSRAWTVADAIERHRAYLRESGLYEERARQGCGPVLATRCAEPLARLLDERSPAAVADVIERILARRLDPGSAVRELLNGK